MKKGTTFLIIGGLAITVGAIYGINRYIKYLKRKKAEEAEGQIGVITGDEAAIKAYFNKLVNEIKALSRGYKPSGWTADKDAKTLENAISGWGTDEDAIYETLNNKSRWQLKLIFDKYKELYGSELADDLLDDLNTEELGQVTNILKTAQSGSSFTGFQLYSTIFTK